MLIHLIRFCSLLVITFGNSAGPLTSKMPLEIQKSATFVFVNRRGENELELQHILRARGFSEGLAAVYGENHQWGFIDKTGQLRIPLTFDEAGDFSEGVARVRFRDAKNRQTYCGFINREGTIVFKNDFDSIYDFGGGVALGEKQGSFYLIDKQGKSSVFLSPNLIPVGDNPSFRGGLLAVRDKATGRCGYTDLNGKLKISPQFHNCASFSEGKARISVILNNVEKVGFINTDGEIIISPVFDVDSDFARNSTDFSEGRAGIISSVASVRSNSKFMFIDEKGKIVLRTIYERVEPFKNGMAAFFDSKRQRFGFIDLNGEVIIGPEYLTAEGFSEGLAIVSVP